MKSSHRLLLFAACAVLAGPVSAKEPAASPSPTTSAASLQEGDIVFQDSSKYANGQKHSDQAPAITKLTGSNWTHCGIVFIENGKPVVYEAAGPVRVTPFKEWANGGVNGFVKTKRLRTGLTDEQKADLKKEAVKYLKRPYDRRFEWGDDLLYCSEYVWKCFQRAPSLALEVGLREKWDDFHWKDADKKTADMLKERFPETNGKPPVNEVIITPKAIFESSLLADVP